MKKLIGLLCLLAPLFLNAQTKYVGTFVGNGASVTNLNGTNIQAGTINSNGLDTSTKSMLGNGGTGMLTNQFTTNAIGSAILGAVAYSNNVALSANANLYLSNLTASRILTSTTAGGVTNLGVSSSTPLNADGTLSTFAQVSSVFPALTNSETRVNALPFTAIATNGLIGAGPFLAVSNNVVVMTNVPPAAGGVTFNPNQFSVGNGSTNIISGAPITNAALYTSVAIGTSAVQTAGTLLEGWNTQGTKIIDLNTNGLMTVSNAAVNGLTASRAVLTDSNKKLSSAAASGAVPLDADGSAATFVQINSLGNTITTNNATLTSGRVQVGDGARGIANATASGAVPIDADGSATTFGQVQTLAPGTIHTNGMSVAAQFSNNVALSALAFLYPSNLTAGKVLTATTAGGITNSGLGAVPINADTTATTSTQVNALFPSYLFTNSLSVAATFSNNVALSALAFLYPSNLTAARLLTFTAAGGITNLGISSASPVNSDGTASTFAQFNALAPNAGVFQIVTNGGGSFTNTGNIQAATFNATGIISGNGSGLTNLPNTVPALVETNFVLNTLYTNLTGSLLLVDAVVTFHLAAVNGQAALDLFADQSGGNTYSVVGRFAASSAVTTIAMDYTNGITAVLSNNACYYFTNNTTGAGNTAALVRGQKTTLAGGIVYIPSGVALTNVAAYGTWTNNNTSSANWVGGLWETNYNTGNWLRHSNGILFLGLTNTSTATIQISATNSFGIMALGTNATQASDSQLEIWNPQGVAVMKVSSNGLTTVSNLSSTTITNSGGIKQSGSSLFTGTTVHSNSLALSALSFLYLTNVQTAGALLVHTAAGGVTNSGLGAVPIDSDGTATTFAQVNALAPTAGAAYIITNATSVAYSNNTTVAAAKGFYLPTNYTAANFAINNNASFLIVSNNNLFFVTKTKTNLIINGN